VAVAWRKVFASYTLVLNVSIQESMPYSPEQEKEARESLAMAYRLLASLGFNEGVCNHLTTALPGNTTFLVIAHGIAWSQCQPQHLCLVDAEGTVLAAAGDGSLKPEVTAVCIHAAVHSQLGYGRATCVFHTHMPNATALTCLQAERGGRILPIHQNACRYLGVTSYDDTFNGLGDSDTEGNRIASTIQDGHRILLMGNHGVMAVGGSPAECFDDLYYLERTSANQVLALSAAGGDVGALRTIDSAVARDTHAAFERDRVQYAQKHFDSFRGLV
jgi:ribulose-5-phosphate 4-epimerase/fuculose-1-phosphate aldolase